MNREDRSIGTDDAAATASIRARSIAEPFLARLGTEACRRLSASIEEALLSSDRAQDCCVPMPSEPYFVLLGRDPQAPDLVDAWADVRAIAEPSSEKPKMARHAARAMREWKRDNPGFGMPTARLDAAKRMKAAVRGDDASAGSV